MHVGATVARRAASPLQVKSAAIPPPTGCGHRQRVGGKNVAVVDKRLESMARSESPSIRSARRGRLREQRGDPPLAPRSAIHSAPEKRRVRSPHRVESQGRRRSQRVDRISRFHGFLQDRSHAQMGWRHITRQRKAGCLCAVYEFGSEAVDAQNRRCRQAFGRWCGGGLLHKSPARHIATRVMAPQTKGRRSQTLCSFSNTRA